MSAFAQVNAQVVGQYVTVDPNCPKIQELAAWAVNAYNEQQNATLVYVNAYKAEKQVVNGTNYRIWLAATNGCMRRNYLTQVYENKDTVKLVSFKPELQENERVAIAN